LREDAHEIFQLERAAFRVLGMISTAVHVNGFTEDGLIWLARRSDSKLVDPGLLDNMTAGGISALETVQSSVHRELWEEAGIVSHQLKNLFPVGFIELRRSLPPYEIHHEKIYTFDMLIEDHWTPANQDGEVQNFQKYSIEEVIEFILDEKMTHDAAVVTADFILRNIKQAL
jgi:isopentenyldiphosphate isomerase